MPKYDAFGREIGEDPLEGLGWSAGGAAIPPPEARPEPVRRPEPEPPEAPPEASPSGLPQPPPAAAMPPQPPPAAARPPQPPPPVMSSSHVTVPPVVAQFTRRRRRGPRGFRIMSRLISLAVFVAIAATVVPNITSEIKDATDINIDVSDRPEIRIPGADDAPADAKTPVGLQPRSLIRPAAFRRAIADLRGRDLGRVKSLRLAPDRIDAQLLTSGGRLRSVQHAHDGEFRQFSLSGPGFGHLTTVPFAKLDPDAPQRLVKAAAERLGKPTSRIDYLVASEFDGDVMWNAYFKGGRHFQADRRGKIVRRVS